MSHANSKISMRRRAKKFRAVVLREKSPETQEIRTRKDKS